MSAQASVALALGKLGVLPNLDLEAQGHVKWVGDDQLHVILVGTGCPMFDKTRSGPCTAVIAGEHYFLVDTGPGTQRALEAARLPRNRLSGVLLTHFHSDHIGDLGEVMTMSWIGGGDKRKEGGDGRLPVYGGPGVKNLTDGFNEAYVHDRKYRTEHHGAEYLPPTTSGVMPVEFAVPEAEGDALWEQELEVPLLPAPRMNWKEGASAPSPEVVKVTAFHVQHDPCKPAYGYKFEYKGRTVVISGDTGHCPSIVKQSAGVDLLVHEACACHQVERMIDLQEAAGNTKNVKLLTDLSQPDTHTSPEIVMDIAKEANVKHLAYTHIVPPMRNLIILRYMWSMNIDSSGWGGSYTIGEDGHHFCFPAGENNGMYMIDTESGAQDGSPAAKRAFGIVALLAMFHFLAPSGDLEKKRHFLALLFAMYAGRRASI